MKLLALMEHVITTRPTDWYKIMHGLNDRLVDYLRDEKNETPNWSKYPNARSWFTQNGMKLPKP